MAVSQYWLQLILRLHKPALLQPQPCQLQGCQATYRRPPPNFQVGLSVYGSDVEMYAYHQHRRRPKAGH